MTELETRTMIDEYIALNSKIKKLELELAERKDQIIALGEGAHRTAKGQVTVTLSETHRLNNDLLKAKFGEEVLADCYKTSSSITVRVTKF